MLDHTPLEIVERESLTINPAKVCQPIGATWAALGIHGCMPVGHGSQGCVSYLRMTLSRHLREPAISATSSFTESSAVFGGIGNLKQAIKNVISIYKPEVIAIYTTCVAETIGDDVGGTVKTMIEEGDIPETVKVIHTSTPSYRGSHITGFSNMTTSMATQLTQKTNPNGKINVIPGFVSPADVREIKRLLKIIGINSIVFPDVSDVLDAPMSGEYSLYPKGGTRVEELMVTANSSCTIALGSYASSQAASTLEKYFNVPAHILPLPMGVRNTDLFMMKLREITGKDIPEEIEDERGRLVDMLCDLERHFYEKRVAIAGDPDTVLGILSIVRELNMIPVHVVTGTPVESFTEDVRKIAGDMVKVRVPGDLFYLHQLIKNDPVDLIIGNSHCKYIARAEDIPHVRIGFPITDRAFNHYFPEVGYTGTMRVVKMINDALLERRDRDAKDEDYELVM